MTSFLRKTLPVAIGWALFFLLAPPPAGAVTAQQQAERLLILNGLLFDFKLNTLDPKNRTGFGVDVIYLPKINDHVGGKDEEFHRPPVIPRPRGRFHFGAQFLGAALIPPIPVNKTSAAVYSLEYGIRFPFQEIEGLPSFTKNFELLLRVSTTNGRIQGPFTDPNGDDTITLEIFSFEGTVAATFLENFKVFAGIGQGVLDSSIEIGSDGASVETVGFEFPYGFTGVTYRRGEYRYALEQDFHKILRNFTFSFLMDFK